MLVAEGCGGVVCARLPEHPREQDCVTRPLPSLFRFRLFPIFQTHPPLRPQNQLSVASSQLPENLRMSWPPALGMTERRAKGEKRTATNLSPYFGIFCL